MLDGALIKVSTSVTISRASSVLRTQGAAPAILKSRQKTALAVFETRQLAVTTQGSYSFPFRPEFVRLALGKWLTRQRSSSLSSVGIAKSLP